MIAPRKRTSYLFLLPAIALLCGCGGNSMNTAQPTPTPQQATSSLRVVDGNGSTSSVNVMIDGASVANNVTFLKNTGYFTVPAGSHQVTLQGWVNPPNESFMQSFPENTKTTMLFIGWGPFGSGAEPVMDDVTPPAAGNFKLRIVDGTFGAGFPALDVFVLPAATAPSGTPTIPGMTVSENSPSQYLSFAAGNYHVVFTDFQTLNVEFDTGPITFSAGQNRTLFLIQNCPGNTCSSGAYTSMLLPDLN